MNKTITFLSIATVAIIAGGLLTLTLTNAEEANVWFMKQGMHGNFQAVKDAVTANDFKAFQTAIAWSPFAEKITTEEQFMQLQTMHTLMQEGNIDEAKAIAEELWLPLMGMGMHGEWQAVKDAIKANDYTTFQNIVAGSNSPFATIDTPEAFAKLVKMHSLLDEAKVIAEELDLPMMHTMGHHRKGKGMMKMMMQ